MKSTLKKINGFRHAGKGIMFLKSKGYCYELYIPQAAGYNDFKHFEKIEGGYRLHLKSMPGNTRSHQAIDFLKGDATNENETV